MKYRTIGQDPGTRREVSVLALGAMHFGTGTDEETAFAVLDRYVEAGGTFIDTSNNYAFWVNSSQGGESEAVLGRWRASRQVSADVVIATKLGGRPVAAGMDFAETAKPENIEGLSAKVIRESAERSRDTLGVEKIDLLYAHVEDVSTPLQETIEGFAELVADGTVGLLGVSNHWSWRVERARAAAAAAGLPGYEVLQYQHSYLRARTDRPGRRSPVGNQGFVSGDLLTYLSETPELTLVAYSPLLAGAYVRADRPLGPDWDHAGNPLRRKALDEVAKETGATVNQVVLSWMIGGAVPIIPLVGASSVKQIEESLAAVDLELTADQRAKLDSAN
ncbi:aldo/keto reductase [Kibdelosporangium phytohabitans]|uniref:Oxidoreductase n=1 Tax=Kibdelosporangium phytohabitans TaxID=860235 RepID=A0A0N9I4E1_9PSEU|nr:aldo/keto reductase [Kibdelosporangium phytohabitans]ALG10932.1 oxidoreductase [Kibdelosporangium phytohabitans]MBE1462129.1 aryl-alcohol dehydrogenase-like predicted oxidoreductase [Kibdelosporangium phytohabitans]